MGGRAGLFVLVVGALVAGSAAAQEAPGPSSGEEIDPLLVPFRGEIDFCFERERSLFPGAHGTVTVRATIDATGRAVAPALEASTLDAPGSVVAACLVAAVGRWSFPTGADVVGVEHHLRFTLRPTAPVRIAGTPAEIEVSWHLQYRDGVGLRHGDTVADDLLAEMERYRSDVRACILAEPDARAAGGGLEILVRVPGGGDIGRDDVEVAGGTYDGRHPLSRCILHLVPRFEARSASVSAIVYRWTLVWTVDLSSARGTSR